MKDINLYIIEKLIINKDSIDKAIDMKYSPKEGDKVMTINFLSGQVDCVLKTGIIKSIFRNTIILQYDSESIGCDTMFVLNENGEDYLGKSKNGDLVFDKETGLKLIKNCKDNNIYLNYNLIVSKDNLDRYLNEIEKELRND